MIVAVYVKTPSKGKALFYNDYLSFIIGKDKTDINLTDFETLDLYIDKGIYSIVIQYKKKFSIFQLDILFQKEKEALQEVITRWKGNGINVNVFINQKLTNQSIKESPPYSHITNNNRRIDFTKNKIKIRPGIPFYFYSKKEIYSLVITCLDCLGWEIINMNSDLIIGVTDPVMKALGDNFLIKFKDNCFAISSSNNSGSLFITIGSKLVVRSFLEKMTTLDNEQAINKQ